MNYELRIIVRRIAAAFVAAIAVSCIEPLTLTPDIAGEITALEVEGQTRTPSINAATRTVNIEVGGDVDPGAVKVTRIELIETASCDISAGDVLDLSVPLKVVVTTAARYEWTISATPAYTADRPLPGGDFDQWHRTNTLGEIAPNGKVWNPWPEGGIFGESRWWDTGNIGVTLLGDSNSTPTEPGTGSPANPEGRAARLDSRLIAGLKVAGGNIYFGRFGELVPGTLDATCHIGHPWQTKPKALKGWYRYYPQSIDEAPANYVAIHPYGLSRGEWLGSMDSLHINIALWASPDGRDIPFTVNTDPRNGGANFVDFRRDTPGVIAYGSFVSGEEQDEWAEFNLDMEYLKPEYLSVGKPLPDNTRLFLQVTSSKNCNYFIAGTSGGGPDGKTGSLMYVDEFELVY